MVGWVLVARLGVALYTKIEAVGCTFGWARTDAARAPGCSLQAVNRMRRLASSRKNKT